jgi:molybdopterin-binding protein
MVEGEVQQIGRVDDVFRHPANAKVAGVMGVETILRGTVGTLTAGTTSVHVGQREVAAVLREEFREHEKVLLCIRAEEVTLQLHPHTGESARNHFAGRVESIESDGVVERVTVDCGFLLAAIITRNAREEMGLATGTQVTASVKATAIHVIRL